MCAEACILSGFLKVFSRFRFVTDALPNKPYLLYSNLTNFGAIGLNNLSRSDVMVGLRSVVALDWDSVENKIYYGDHSLREMYRVDMDGRNKELLMTNVGMVEGIAVDWVGRSIYWTSYTSEQIEVATLDGKYRKVLINTGLEFARGMALDPGEG